MRIADPRLFICLSWLSCVGEALSIARSHVVVQAMLQASVAAASWGDCYGSGEGPLAKSALGSSVSKDYQTTLAARSQPTAKP
jgi:hypothetical protein